MKLLFALLSSLVLCHTTLAANGPNILFAIADDWGPHASAYGTPWIKTPSFDRVAKDGLLFNNAYTPMAKCAPSRACILTGRNTWQLKDAANHIPYFPAEFKGWAEALTEHGWNVGHTMKGWAPGVANDANGKPRLMTGVPFNKRKAKPPTAEISNNDYAGNFTDFLDAAPKDKPWCFWYGAVEPHRGYEFGSGVKLGGKKLIDIDHVPAYWPDNETVRNDMLDYAFEAEHFDRHLGRMLETLEKRGLLENTLVIVTSDHGMPFPRSKGNANAMANHVPMAVMWKQGINKPGRKVDDFISFVDLAPTLIEVAGLKWAETGMAESPGRSLTDIFASERSGKVIADRDHVLIGKERTDIGRPNDWGYPIRGIIKEGVFMVENFEPTRWPGGNPETGYMDCDAGATKTWLINAHRQSPTDPFWSMCFGLRPGVELYDLKQDPDFMSNLAEKADATALLTSLREQLHSELKRQGDSRMEGKGEIFDNYPHAAKANVGFYEKFMRGEPVKAGWIAPTDIEKKSLP
jgi:arylsulfatase A-like enzyme